MIIVGTLETIDTGATERIQIEADDYQRGYDALCAQVPEGARLIGVRVNR